MIDLSRLDVIDEMVAGDTFDAITERVVRMVSAGIPMALAVREFTWTDQPAKVRAGLVLARGPRNEGIRISTRDDYVSCEIALTGQEADDYEAQTWFGFSADVGPFSGNAIREQAWKRYREGQAEHKSFFQRRRSMTHIVINGGVAGELRKVDDSITVSAWNDDGVRTERTLGFAYVKGVW